MGGGSCYIQSLRTGGGWLDIIFLRIHFFRVFGMSVSKGVFHFVGHLTGKMLIQSNLTYLLYVMQVLTNEITIIEKIRIIGH